MWSAVGSVTLFVALCDHNPPVLQTGRRTHDDWIYCTSLALHGKKGRHHQNDGNNLMK